MIVKLAYGKTSLDIDLPDDWNVTVITPQFVLGLDPLAALQHAPRADPTIARAHTESQVPAARVPTGDVA